MRVTEEYLTIKRNQYVINYFRLESELHLPERRQRVGLMKNSERSLSLSHSIDGFVKLELAHAATSCCCCC